MQITEGATPITVTGGYPCGGYGYGDGMGGNWIWAFLLFAILGNSFNRFGGYGYGDSDIWKAQEFGQLENSVRATNNGICDSTFALNNSIKDGNFNILRGIDGVNQNLGNAVCQSTYELNNSIRNVGFDLQQCCCQTQRSIDGVNFNAERNANAIIQSNNANTQKILDAMCASEKNALTRELDETKRMLMEQRIIASQKPVAPIPAYTVPNPYQTYYGYSTCGCGCGCNV